MVRHLKPWSNKTGNCNLSGFSLSAVSSLLVITLQLDTTGLTHISIGLSCDQCITNLDLICMVASCFLLQVKVVPGPALVLQVAKVLGFIVNVTSLAKGRSCFKISLFLEWFWTVVVCFLAWNRSHKQCVLITWVAIFCLGLVGSNYLGDFIFLCGLVRIFSDLVRFS